MNAKFVKLLLLLFFIPLYGKAQQATPVTSTQVVQMLKSNAKLVVLDVRTSEEFKSGHIKGAVNIDIRQPDAVSKIDKLDHNTSYIVHCRTNHRSKIAVDHMLQSGFTSVYQMTDGFNGWSANNLAVQK